MKLINPTPVVRIIKRLFWLSFCLGIFSRITAQLLVNGQILAQSVPVPFATVRLVWQDSTLLQTAADINGRFCFAYPFRLQQTYVLSVSATGYKNFTKAFSFPGTRVFGAIELLADSSVLHNVTVIAKTPLIGRNGDRYVVEVAKSLLADGNSGFEVLQKIPLLRVDSKGNIYAKGNQLVSVMINDVLQRMTGDELQEYLKSLRSEDISRIEIITNPPAEFEAQGAGGIVHIILKKPSREGLTGVTTLQLRDQAGRPYSSVGTSLDYKRKKTYLSFGISVNRDVKPITDSSLIAAPAANQNYHNATARVDAVSRAQYRVALAQDLSGQQSISVLLTAGTNRLDQSFQTSQADIKGGVLVTGNTHATRVRNSAFYSTTINYMWITDTIGSNLKIIADHSGNRKMEESQFDEIYSDTLQDIEYRHVAPNATGVYSMQADLTHVFPAKLIAKAGLKYVSIQRDNQVIRHDLLSDTWVVNRLRTDHFRYKENLLMLYASLEKNEKNTTVKAGLRGELTETAGNSITRAERFTRRYMNLFPSLYISQNLAAAKGNMIFFSYSGRLTRPSLSDLNPNRLQFSSNTTVTGNPLLNPQYSHVAEVGATLTHGATIILSATSTRDVITLMASADSNNFINYSPVNLDKSREFGLTLTAPLQVLPTWTVNNTAELSSLRYQFNDLPVRQFTVYLRSAHTLAIKKWFDADIFASWRSATRYANIASPAQFYLDVGLSRKMLQKHATLRFAINDLFNSIAEREISREGNKSIFFYRKRPTRTISVSFTYHFSSGKSFEPGKVEQGSSELRARIAN